MSSRTKCKSRHCTLRVGARAARLRGARLAAARGLLGHPVSPRPRPLLAQRRRSLSRALCLALHALQHRAARPPERPLPTRACPLLGRLMARRLLCGWANAGGAFSRVPREKKRVWSSEQVASMPFLRELWLTRNTDIVKGGVFPLSLSLSLKSARFFGRPPRAAFSRDAFFSSVFSYIPRRS